MQIDALKKWRDTYSDEANGYTTDELDEYIDLLDWAIQQIDRPTSDEVQKAISQLQYAREQDREFDDGTFVKSLDLAIRALKQYEPKEPPEGDYESAIKGIICVRAGRECQKKWATKDWDKTKWQRVIDECDLAIQCLEYCRDLKAGE